MLFPSGGREKFREVARRVLGEKRIVNKKKKKKKGKEKKKKKTKDHEKKLRGEESGKKRVTCLPVKGEGGSEE